jgi:hypothetical protein
MRLHRFERGGGGYVTKRNSFGRNKNRRETQNGCLLIIAIRGPCKVRTERMPTQFSFSHIHEPEGSHIHLQIASQSRYVMNAFEFGEAGPLSRTDRSPCRRRTPPSLRGC